MNRQLTKPKKLQLCEQCLNDLKQCKGYKEKYIKASEYRQNCYDNHKQNK